MTGLDHPRARALAQRVAGCLRARRPPSQTHQDAVQDALVAIARRVASGTFGFQNEAWLYMRVRGDLMDQYRQYWRRQRLSQPHADQPAALSRDVQPARTVNQDAVFDVRTAIASLPPLLRLVMTQCGLHARRQADVAAELGWPIQKVKSAFTRARRAMKKLLGAYADG